MNSVYYISVKSKFSKWLVMEGTEEKSTRPFNCSQCDKVFNHKSSLKYHELCHSGLKQYSCSYCDYKCNTSARLKAHERTHTGEKPLSCAYFDKTFAQSQQMKHHEKTHTV